MGGITYNVTNSGRMSVWENQDLSRRHFANSKPIVCQHMPAVNVEKLIRLRENEGWSQDALAKKVGCRKQQIERVEKDARASVSTLKDIADALGVKVEDLRRPDVNVYPPLLNDCLKKLEWRWEHLGEKLKRWQVEKIYSQGKLEYEAHETLVKWLNEELEKNGHERIETLELPYCCDEVAINNGFSFFVEMSGQDIRIILPDDVSDFLTLVRQLAGAANIIGMHEGSCCVVMESNLETWLRFAAAINDGDFLRWGITELFGADAFAKRKTLPLRGWEQDIGRLSPEQMRYVLTKLYDIPEIRGFIHEALREAVTREEEF